MSIKTILISVSTMICVNFISELLKYTLPAKAQPTVQVQLSMEDLKQLRAKPASVVVTTPAKLKKFKDSKKEKVAKKVAVVLPSKSKKVIKIGQFKVETRRSESLN